MNHLQHQHVLILGLGVSGLAMAHWCTRCGAQVTVADSRAAPPQLAHLQRDLPGARFVAGALDASLLQGSQPVQAVFKSPGLAPPAIASLMIAASAMNIRSTGELGLFSEALAQLQAERGYRPVVLAITGTNGKTTVTAL
ncbi:MAG TPA: UDP-N-acetylmuramoyl-L-alanine--D-glutamate ligase, partial [Rhodoferax sp.]|nr:UDP-N-acetylmuramoyl-L-alanine--D-glutamate ligase [Rhodoferax sp.]